MLIYLFVDIFPVLMESCAFFFFFTNKSIHVLIHHVYLFNNEQERVIVNLPNLS